VKLHQLSLGLRQIAQQRLVGQSRIAHAVAALFAAAAVAVASSPKRRRWRSFFQPAYYVCIAYLRSVLNSESSSSKEENPLAATLASLPWMTLFGGELLSELPSTSPLVSEEGGLGWPGEAVLAGILLASSSRWLQTLLVSESARALLPTKAAKSPLRSKLCDL